MVKQMAHRPGFADPSPGEVPVSVVREVAERRPVRRGEIFDAERAVFVEAVPGGGGERARIAHLTVRADVAQGDGGHRLLRHLDHFPQDLVEAPGAAVERIGAVVHGNPVGAAVEGEAAAGDPVRDPPDRGAEVLRVLQIIVDRRMAERDVGQGALPVRREHRLDRGAVGDDPRLDAVRIGKKDRLDRAPVGQPAETFPGRADHRLPWLPRRLI
jgi:hypothetical protein